MDLDNPVRVRTSSIEMTFLVKRDVLSVDMWFLELGCLVDELVLINAISIDF